MEKILVNHNLNSLLITLKIKFAEQNGLIEAVQQLTYRLVKERGLGQERGLEQLRMY